MVNLFLSCLLKTFTNPTWVDELTKIIHRNSDVKIEFIETNDIWCRDFFPIQVGKNKFVQFSLTKDYYPKKNEHYRTDPSPICTHLEISPYIPEYNGNPIYLDGGNVIRGFNRVIMTNKVFKDNKIQPEEKDDFLKYLTNILEVDLIIVIPREPGEYSGHSDGMVRFVDERTVIVNDYKSVQSNQRFVTDLYRTLHKSGLEVIEVPYNPRFDMINGNQPSSGVYVNYLQVENKIFLPIYGSPNFDNLSLSRFKGIFGIENVIPVPSLELSLLGGVLNCISWEISN